MFAECRHNDSSSM